MPFVKAALLGILVLCAETVPVAKKIGQQDVIRFAPEADAHQLADLSLKRMEHGLVFQLRKRVRQELIPLLSVGLS